MPVHLFESIKLTNLLFIEPYFSFCGEPEMCDCAVKDLL